MDIKELIREKVFTEIIAERGGIILSQHQQIEGLQKEIEQAREAIAEKNTLLVDAQNEIIELKRKKG